MDNFNLVLDPWVPVLPIGTNRTTEVSLIDLFENWNQYQEIHAEYPPTTYAIYRLVLAILHSAYRGPVDLADWRRIWRDRGKQAIAYLEQQQERFDLLHPEFPFCQDPALQDCSPAPFYSAVHFQPDATPVHFSHLHAWSGYCPDAAAIARALVRLQTIDLTGLKSAYPGYGGSRSAVAPPSVNAANILVQGNNLRETLMLNLVQYCPDEQDLPTWETETCYGGIPGAVVPTGYLHYLTFAWRRCYWQQGRGIVLTPGDSIPIQPSGKSTSASTSENGVEAGVLIKTWEPAIAYRGDSPVRYSLSRAPWRDAHAFLGSTDKTTRPRVLDWVAQLQDEGIVKQTTTLMVIGWSADKAKSLGWGQEYLSVPTRLLQDPEAYATLSDAIAIAQRYEQIFRSFAGSPYWVITQALRHPNASLIANACDGATQYWAELRQQVPRLLRDIQAMGENGNEILAEWQQFCAVVAKRSFRNSIEPIQSPEARGRGLNSLGYWLTKKLTEKPDDQDPGSGDQVLSGTREAS